MAPNPKMLKLMTDGGGYACKKAARSLKPRSRTLRFGFCIGIPTPGAARAPLRELPADVFTPRPIDTVDDL